MRWTVALLLAACCAPPAISRAAEPPVPVPPSADTARRSREDTLLRHGINPDAASTLRFLEKGFPREIEAAGLPAEPEEKYSVLTLAITQLGILGDRKAIPMLTRLAREDYPDGCRRLIERSVERLPVDYADSRRRDLKRLLSLNAIVALGLIGDASAAGVVSDAMRRDGSGAFVTEGATALGLMGRGDGVATVVALCGDPEGKDTPGGFRTLFDLTGRNWGLTENSSLARRKDIVAKMREWFQAEGKSLRIDRADVMRRRLGPSPATDPPVESIRGALRATRDIVNFDRRLAGRDRLRSLGKAIAPELLAIAKDPMEDLDIRTEAMKYLSAADPEGAKPVMEDLEDDAEDAVVRETATSLLVDIDDYIKRGE